MLPYKIFGKYLKFENLIVIKNCKKIKNIILKQVFSPIRWKLKIQIENTE
jgi:hypothetical protein